MRPEVIDIFLNLKDYSEAVEAYSNSVILPDCMPDDRNWLLHRLLSLPSVGATDLLSKIDVLSSDFYCGMLNCEACRLAAVMYCVHVTFPVPRSIYARRTLLPQMKESIGKIHLAAGHQALRELVLWCVVVGGIAASGQPERSWFAAQLFTVSTFLDLKQWSDARAVLRKFAWLDAACDTGGSAFWDEVF
jgi:Fungal specific transcription factor domain